MRTVARLDHLLAVWLAKAYDAVDALVRQRVNDLRSETGGLQETSLASRIDQTTPTSPATPSKRASWRANKQVNDSTKRCAFAPRNAAPVPGSATSGLTNCGQEQ